jgi:hypothetical protein
MATKTIRRIVTAGVAGSAALVLAAAPAGASSPVGSAGSNSSGVSSGVDNGTAVKSSAYTFTVLQFSCTGSAEFLTIKQVEHGQSGTTRFKQGFKGQFLTTAGWRTSGTRVVASPSFPNDGRSFFFSSPTKYTYGNTAPASHRIIWAGQWLGAGGQVIAHASRTFICQ